MRNEGKKIREHMLKGTQG